MIRRTQWRLMCVSVVSILVQAACSPDPSTESTTAAQQPQTQPPADVAVPVPFPATFPVPVPVTENDQPVPIYTEDDVAYVGTYTIIGRDPDTGDLGVGVVASVPAGGALIPAVRAGVGAVAVAAKPNLTWKDQGLDLLAQGLSAQEVVDRLVQKPETDDAKRQLLVVDAKGGIAHYTGNHVLFAKQNSFVETGKDCAVLVCLLNPGFLTPKVMIEKFESTAGLPMSERILLAMDAGWNSERANQDYPPGSQLAPHPPVSAALIAVRPDSGYDARTDRMVDLRIDFSRECVPRLRHAYEAWVEMVLGPRLRSTMRMLPTDAPMYAPTKEWVDRLVQGKEVGER